MRARRRSPAVGAGDALIRHELEGAGVASELVEEVVDLLEPERERARRIVEHARSRSADGPLPGAEGVPEETIAGVVASGRGDELG